MSYSNPNVGNIYNGNGSDTIFGVNFDYFEAETSVIQVELWDYDTDPLLPVKQSFVLGVDYTIDESGYPATNVVTTVAVPNNYKLYIYRSTTPIQSTSYANGAFPAESVEEQLDKTTQIAQENRWLNEKAVKLPKIIEDLGQFDPELPDTIKNNPDRPLVVNATGDGWDWGLSTSELETLVADAAASEAAAAASEAAAAASEAQAAADAAAAALSAAALSSISDPLLDNVAGQALTLTIDETVDYSMMVEYVATRGTNIEYGRLLITDQGPFALDIVEKVGDAGLTFSIPEAGGIGTLTVDTDASSAGTIRMIVKRFTV